MKYYIVNNNTYYTQALLKKLILKNNELVDNIDNCDFILFSACDILDIKKLENIRKKYPYKKIIIGGHNAIYYKLYSIFADYVNIGQGFNFFDCKNEDQIKELNCIYFKEKNTKIIYDNYINWDLCPIVEIKKNIYSYWGGVGCKKKCSFCLTSWINKHQLNDISRINKYMKIMKEKKVRNYYIIWNEYSNGIGGKSGDIILKDYIKLKRKITGKVRFGVEFANYENRRKYGKIFTDEDFYIALEKSAIDKTELFCFCIGGIENKEDWYNFFNKIPLFKMINPRVMFKFTNIQYEMFTPIYKKRYEQKLENYIDMEFISKIEMDFKFNKRLRFLPVHNPVNSIYRTGLSAVGNLEEYKILNEKYKKCLKQNDNDIIYNYVFTELLKNDYGDTIIY